MREVVNGVVYILSTGCQRPYVPKEPAAAQQPCTIAQPVAHLRHLHAAGVG